MFLDLLDKENEAPADSQSSAAQPQAQTPSQPVKKTGAFSRAFSAMSANPTDGAGRFNVLAPFHFLSPQGRQEGDTADTLRAAQGVQAQSALEEQRQVAAYIRAHPEASTTDKAQALANLHLTHAQIPGVEATSRHLGTEANAAQYNFDELKKTRDYLTKSDPSSRTPEAAQADDQTRERKLLLERQEQGNIGTGRDMVRSAIDTGYYTPEYANAERTSEASKGQLTLQAKQLQEQVAHWSQELVHGDKAMAVQALHGLMSNPTFFTLPEAPQVVKAMMQEFNPNLKFNGTAPTGAMPGYETAMGVHNQIMNPPAGGGKGAGKPATVPAAATTPAAGRVGPLGEPIQVPSEFGPAKVDAQGKQYDQSREASKRIYELLGLHSNYATGGGDNSKVAPFNQGGGAGYMFGKQRGIDVAQLEQYLQGIGTNNPSIDSAKLAEVKQLIQYLSRQ